MDDLLPAISSQRGRTAVDGKRYFLQWNEQFEDLYNQQRFAEAEIVAKQARTVNPDARHGVVLEQKARLQRRIAFNEQFGEQSAERFLDVMDNLELSVISPAVKRTLGRNKGWSKLSLGWGAYRRPDVRRLVESEQSTEKSLRQTVSLHFRNTPLMDVIRHISVTCGVNFKFDTQAMKTQGLTVNQRVSIDADGVTLQSALNLLLAQAGGLVYDIENEVLRITTRLAKASKDSIRPQFGRDPRYFCDLMSHAPGLNTSRAD
ncbi:MAG: DUF4974 domain-containing protein, partial [Fuerstiella sp.]|nr:DUF4974 domain-containing protein [Fuerstiella sp.]